MTLKRLSPEEYWRLSPEERKRRSEEMEKARPGEPPKPIDWTGKQSERYKGLAATSDEAAMRKMRSEGFRGHGATASWEPVPSQDTVAEVAAATMADQAARNIERDAEKNAAHATAGAYNRGADPPGQGRESGGKAPTDPPLPKGGTGPGSDRPAEKPADKKADPNYYDRVKMVKTADGKVVAVDMEAGKRIVKAGGDWMDYSTAVGEAGGRDQNVASGPQGTAYFGGGAEDAAAVAAAIPQQGDRSPGWASRKALNELYRTGQLSMNARDVMDRRNWERAEEARDMEQDLVRAQAQAAIAAEKYKVLEASIDPLERARIEAEGKWGGKYIEEQATGERVRQAVGVYRAIMQEIDNLRKNNAPSPALDQHIAMLERFARDQANIIMGHAVRDPREDPLAALAAAVSSPRAPQTTNE